MVALTTSTPNGLPDSQTLLKDPFAAAIYEFIEEIKNTKDKTSSFFRQMLREEASIHDGGQQSKQVDLSSKSLATFIHTLDQDQRKSSVTRRISSRLEPLVDGLNQYTTALDVGIQGAATLGAPIYSGARLVLQLAASYTKFFEDVVNKLETIGHLLQCFRIYSTTPGYLEPMRPLLVRTYKSVLTFWRSAAALFSRSGIKTLVRSLAKPLDSCFAKLAGGLDRDIEAIKNLSTALQAQNAQIHDDSQTREHEFSRRRRIAQWLGPCDVRTDLDGHLDARHPGTCEWLFAEPAYKRWRMTNSNDVLWLNARPGSGKSVCSAATIEHLQAENCNVAYFFFRSDDPARRGLLTVLRNLAVQMLRIVPYTPDELFKLYMDDIGQSCIQSVGTAEEVISCLQKHIGRIHLIIDGLDECDDRAALSKSLGKLFAQNTTGISKWFCASCKNPDFENVFEIAQGESIEISANNAQTDIDKFLEENVDISLERKDYISHVQGEAKGNFLWAQLMLRAFTDMTCEEEVEDTLGSFHPGLSECYLLHLTQLSRKSWSQQELARRIILFVVMARQPMSLDELTDAMGVSLTSMSYSSRRVPQRALIKSLCYPLIELDDRNNPLNPILGVFHKSVADFLKQDPKLLGVPEACQKFFVNSESANLDIGKTCMIYLSQDIYAKPRDTDSMAGKSCNKNNFLLYAAVFWHLYLSEAPKSTELFEGVHSFLESSNFWTCMQVQGICAPYHFAPLRQVNSDHFHMDFKAAKVGEIYYPDPLPSWLDDFGENGQRLVRLYQSFVKEWSTVLSCHPESILQCQPVLSEEIHFPYLRDFVGVDGSAALLLPKWSVDLAHTSFHEPVQIHLIQSKNTIIAVMNSFAARNGVLKVLQARADVGGGKIDIIQSATPTSNIIVPLPESWNSAEDGNACRGNVMNDYPATINDEVSILRTLSSAQQMSSWLSSSASSLKQQLARKHPKYKIVQTEDSSVQSDSITVVSQRYLVIPNHEDSESETNDSSDEEEGIPSVRSNRRCTENMLVVFVGDEMKLFTHSTRSERLQRSRPKIHPKGKWILWALDEREVLLWNLESGEQVIQDLSSTEQNLQLAIRFLIDFHFSASSSVLYKCTITSRTIPTREGYLVSDMNLSAYEFHANGPNPKTLLKHIEPFSQTIPLKGAWTTQINGPMADKSRMNLSEAPFKFYWTQADLYVAFGATAIKLARISLALERIEDTALRDLEPGEINHKAQTSLLSHQIFLPSSAPKRGWALAIDTHRSCDQDLTRSSTPTAVSTPSNQSAEESLTALIILNPTSADDTPSTTLSSTILRKNISAASLLGPWVSPSTFLANKSLHPSIAEGTWLIWQPSNHEKSRQRRTGDGAASAGAEDVSGNAAGGKGSEEDGEWVSLEDTLPMSDVLKGNYAAKDRAFVIPIRSGVEWWRKSFVACW